MPVEIAQLQAHQVMNGPLTAIDGQARLKEAMAMMQQHQVTALPVVDNHQRPIGVLSQTDIVRYLYENPEYLVCEVEDFSQSFDEGSLWPEAAQMEFTIDEEQDTSVIEVMTPLIYAVGPDAPLSVVIDEMLARKVHRIFVMDTEGRLDGVISTLDILRHLR
jgi:CBS domain-containing protein